MNTEPLFAYADKQGIVCLAGEPMKNHTSFRIGGPAEAMVYPKREEQCADILALCQKYGLPVLVLGKGSNLLVSDRGLKGVVLSTESLCRLRTANRTSLAAGAGASLRAVAELAMEAGLSGLEFAHGIPGSAGGAVYMNAGAYGGEMRQVVFATRYIDENGRLCTAEGAEHDFGYRKSLFTGRDCLITETIFALRPGEPDEIAARMDELWRSRTEKQPLDYPSAGSVFKRPPGNFAGKLISDCGLGGYAVGGAMVSDKHCGFIVNRGGATARDVLCLIEHIQKTVQAAFGIALECEIKLVGIP